MSSPLVVSSSHPDVADGFVLYLLACSLPRLKRAQAIQQQQQQQPGSERFAYQFNGDFKGIGISLDVDEEGRLIVQHVGHFPPHVMCRTTPYYKPRAKTSERSTSELFVRQSSLIVYHTPTHKYSLPVCDKWSCWSRGVLVLVALHAGGVTYRRVLLEDVFVCSTGVAGVSLNVAKDRSDEATTTSVELAQFVRAMLVMLPVCMIRVLRLLVDPYKYEEATFYEYYLCQLRVSCVRADGTVSYQV